ncbi:MAG TPA: Tim44/TimA family putative adaptor protein [Acidiphilium sp.]|nr:Tim44/TimA family putative adaptor protein [Acidiphilium sp.]
MHTGFPVDIVLLALVAGFLVLRLRSVLGRRTGFERPPMPEPSAGGGAPRPVGPPVIDGVAEPSRPARPVPASHTVVGQALARIAAAERGFDPVRFLETAEGSFRRVVLAFAAGNVAVLRSLLTPAVLATFEQAITARNAAGETQHTEILRVIETTIDEADIIGGEAVIVVRFVSDQQNFTRDGHGQVIAGTESMTEMIDLWTFEKQLGAADPTWRLAAARSG